MIKILKNFLLTGDKSMPELHSKQTGFTYSTYGPLTKHCEGIQKLSKTSNLKHLYRNELDEACFAHDATYSDSKDVAKRTISHNILKYRAYEIDRNRKYDGYQRALASIVYRFFYKKTGSAVSVNQQLAEELHKPIIKNSKEENSMQDSKIIFG